MNDLPLRKRFFVDGETSPALADHARYLKPAMKLLEYVRGQMGGTLDQHLQRETLSDGTKLEAHVRHGQAEIHIDIPAPKREEKPPKEDELPMPYLWVGARIAWERMSAPHDDNAVMLHVFEPGVNGIVGNYPLSPDPRPAYQAAQTVPDAVFPLPWVLYESAAGRSETQSGPTKVGLLTTRNGLICTGGYWDYYNYGPTELAGDVDLPFDPEAEPDAWRSRIYGPNNSFAGNPGQWPLWDAVCVLDPHPKMQPCDDRELWDEAEMSKALGLPVGEKKILPGDYIIKVGAFGICEDGPLEIDLEVRVLKAPHTKRKRLALSIPSFAGYWRAIQPYGHHTPSGISSCPFENGNNPHAANWWQGAVLASPRGTLRAVDFHVPEHGFDPAFYDVKWECGTDTAVDIYIGALSFLMEWAGDDEGKAEAMAYSVIWWQSPIPWSPTEGQIEATDKEQFARIKLAALEVVAAGGLFFWNPDAWKFAARPYEGNLWLEDDWIVPYQAEALDAHRVFRGIVIGGPTYTAHPDFVCPD